MPTTPTSRDYDGCCYTGVMTKAKTLPHMLRTAVLRAVLVTVAIAWGLALVSRMSTAPVAERPAPEGSPRAVVEAMGDRCWTGAAPADMEGKMPGHVIYQKNASGALVGGSVMVGKALEQTFSGIDHGLTVYAFCR